MVMDYGFCHSEHDYCIIETISALMNRGFTCYPEYEIPLDQRKRGYRIVVDILALRDNEEILIEVGTLSHKYEDRLRFLKTLKPKAKIFHITQWKNWLTSFDWDAVNLDPQNQLVSLEKMGESLARGVFEK